MRFVAFHGSEYVDNDDDDNDCDGDLLAFDAV